MDPRADKVQKFKVVREYPYNIMLEEAEYILLDEKGEACQLHIWPEVSANSGDWFLMFDEGPAGSCFLLLEEPEKTEAEDKIAYKLTDEEDVYRLTMTDEEVVLENLGPLPEEP